MGLRIGTSRIGSHFAVIPASFPIVLIPRKNVASLVCSGPVWRACSAAATAPSSSLAAARRRAADAALRAGRRRPAAPPSRPGGGMAQRRVTGSQLPAGGTRQGAARRARRCPRPCGWAGAIAILEHVAAQFRVAQPARHRRLEDTAALILPWPVMTRTQRQPDRARDRARTKLASAVRASAWVMPCRSRRVLGFG